MRKYVLVLALVLFGCSALAQTYHLSDLGAVGNGNSSTGLGINNAGQVVGSSNTPQTLLPAIWTNGLPSSLGMLSTSDGFPFAWSINNSGQVVGTEATPLGVGRTWVYSGGSENDLGYALQQSPFACSINDSGFVVGEAVIPGVSGTPFVFEPGSDGYANGTATLFGLSTGDSGYAYGINTSGTSVGVEEIGVNPVIYEACFYDLLGNVGTIGALGGLSSCAQAINDSGLIVGYTDIRGNSAEHAFSYLNGVWTDLGTLGGTNSYAQAVNSGGVIVGYSDMPGHTSPFVMPGLSKNPDSPGEEQGHAFVYSNGVMQDLNSVVDSSGAGYVIQSATGINDQGQIVAIAQLPGVRHAVLLTPLSNASVAQLAVASENFFATCISGNGSRAGGWVPAGNGDELPALHSLNGNSVTLLPEFGQDVAGGVSFVSADGTVAAGYTSRPVDNYVIADAVYWVNGGPANSIPNPPDANGYNGYLVAASKDASVLVIQDSNEQSPWAFWLYNRINQSYTPAPLPNLSPSDRPNVESISADGSTVAGVMTTGYLGGLPVQVPFIWSPQAGYAFPQVPSMYPSGYAQEAEVRAMSDDGSTFYGTIYGIQEGTYSFGPTYGFVWRQSTGVVILNSPSTQACSADGNIVLTSEGLVWRAAAGDQTLASLLTELGFSPDSVVPSDLLLSRDGSTLLDSATWQELSLPHYSAWDLANNFSYGTNPSGAFTYGQIVNGSFQKLTNVIFDGSVNQWAINDAVVGQDATIWMNQYGSAFRGAGPGAVSLSSDAGTPDARFTAPSTGAYDINVQMGGSTAVSPMGGSGNADVANARLYINGVAQTGTLSNNVMSWQLIQVRLKQGDTVDAVVLQNQGATGGNVATSFSVGSFATSGPVVSNSTFSTSYATNLTTSAPGVLANGANATSLVPTLIQGPSNAASFSLNSDGSFSYTPVAGFAGRDAFVYTVPGAPQGATATIAVASHESNISPSSVAAGSPDLNVTINGNGFAQGVSIDFNGALVTPTVVSPTKLTAVIPAALLASGVTANVTLIDVWGDYSNSIHFYVNNPLPSIGTLAPNSAFPGGPSFTLIVNGSGFVPGSTVKFGGKGVPTTFVSASQVTAQIDASAIAIGKSVSVAVTNPVPGGGDSNAAAFTVTNPAPTLSSLGTSTVTAGGPDFVLTVNGIGFVPNTTVKWGGKGLVTTFVSPSQVTAVVPASMFAIAKTVGVTAVNPIPGGGTSNSLTVNVAK